MRLTRRRTWVADQDPRPEGVGILRAVSAAARAPDDVTPPARSLVRIGAKLAARASARSDWALEPGLPLVRAWIIAYAKANPGKINMASSGNGAADHMSGELFKMMVGVDMVHVPYRGEAPALTDMLGGQVQVIFSTMPGTIEYIRSGSLRPLAVTTATRSEALPDIPTVGEFVPGYEAPGWGNS
jgi:hypothetical protein